MKQAQGKEEEEIRELVCRMHEFQMEQIPPEETLKETYHLSDLFYRRMEDIILKQEKKAGRRKLLRSFGAAAVVFPLLLFLMNMNAGYFVEGAGGAVRQFDDYVEISFQENPGSERIPRYTMEYLPEGYHIEVDEYDGVNSGEMECYNEQRMMISFEYCPAGSVINLNNENIEFLILETEDKTKIYYLKAKKEYEYSFMIWASEDGTAMLHINGVLPEEELLKIQKNIAVKK